MVWHLITPEFPPQIGGVGTYTALLADALTDAGHQVQVWCPPGAEPASRTVHRLSGCFGLTDLLRLNARLNESCESRTLLVQWVPHGYGWQSMNVPFCVWLWYRAAVHQDRLNVMVHEARLAFGGSWKQWLCALVHCGMLAILQSRVSRVFVSIPAWISILKRATLRRDLTYIWSPVPSNVIPVSDPDGVSRLRDKLLAGRDGVIAGHFSMHAPAVAARLHDIGSILLDQHPDMLLLLIGRDGSRVRDRLVGKRPDWSSRIVVTGTLAPEEVSRFIQTCDVMLQPYPEGINTRSGAMMAALAHGRAVITTAGRFTEELWQERAAEMLVPDNDPAAFARRVALVLSDSGMRNELANVSIRLYREKFEMRHTVAQLCQQ